MRDSLEKVFAVLEVVASSDGPVSLKAVSARTGYHPSTVSRVLANLVETGYVRKESYREFSLDLGLVPLGQKALSHFQLPRVANPLIRDAADRLGVLGALAGLHRGGLVYLYRSELQEKPGALSEDYRYPLHRSNCGLVLLAGMDESEARALLRRSLSEGRARTSKKKLEASFRRLERIRADGYSWLLEKAGWNVAFPVNHRGRPFAVSLHKYARPPKKPEKIVLECSLLARRIEAAAATSQ